MESSGSKRANIIPDSVHSGGHGPVHVDVVRRLAESRPVDDVESRARLGQRVEVRLRTATCLASASG